MATGKYEENISHSLDQKSIKKGPGLTHSA